MVAPPPHLGRAPPLPLNLDDSKTYDWMAKLKEKTISQQGGLSKPKAKPNHPIRQERSRSDFDQQPTVVDTDVQDTPPSSPSSPPPPPPPPPPAPPLPPNNGGRIPSNWKKTADADDSTKSSSVITTPKTKPKIGVKLPDFDPSQVKLKPTTRTRKPEPPAPEPPLHKFRLRKTSYHRDDPKGRNSENSDTDEEQTGRDSLRFTPTEIFPVELRLK
ncbi:hypothetical protein BSLG_004040 [Batrachochytrium salamandrivorans]|nr:hypothetical protein BSLG_004040 [Batrachochytrium salamandrivorans]